MSKGVKNVWWRESNRSAVTVEIFNRTSKWTHEKTKQIKEKDLVFEVLSFLDRIEQVTT